MQSTSEWDGRLRHALCAPLSEEGHVLRPPHKEYKHTIGMPKGLWVKICLSSCKCVQAFPVFEQHRYVLAPLTPYRLSDIDYVMLLTFSKYTEFKSYPMFYYSRP